MEGSLLVAFIFTLSLLLLSLASRTSMDLYLTGASISSLPLAAMQLHCALKPGSDHNNCSFGRMMPVTLESLLSSMMLSLPGYQIAMVASSRLQNRLLNMQFVCLPGALHFLHPSTRPGSTLVDTNELTFTYSQVQNGKALSKVYPTNTVPILPFFVVEPFLRLLGTSVLALRVP